MSLRQLPQIKAFDALSGLGWEPPADILARWEPGVRAAAETSNEISILDVIGVDPWTGGGVTARRISAALRAIGPQDVRVTINSPGGDAFEGIAIYNLLREHQGKVTVEVLGMAASAASVIAMAGDEILIGRAAFLMIHDTWVVAIGNQHDMRQVAETLAGFDAALADVYAHRSGLEPKKVAKMMDDETWLGGSKALELGFATGLLDDASIKTDPAARAESPAAAAARALDTLLARSNLPRSERRRLIGALKSDTPSAVDPATPGAGLSDVAADLRRLASIFQP